MDEELSQTQRLCQAIGDCPTSAELWATAGEMNDQWSKYQELHKKLFDVATSAGFTPDQWQAIKRGACH
jgi:hypothetical protein